MLLSCGNPVQPAAEADQRRGGAEEVPEAVEPAPQRRSDQALARWPIDCSTSARSPAWQRL
jgi:ribosomal protein S7